VDDVKILTAEEVVEEVNEDESKNYTISPPSENIEVGDKVYIKDGAGEYLFKVTEKNTLSDGKIFVKASRANDANAGFKLEAFFTYIDYECTLSQKNNVTLIDAEKLLFGFCVSLVNPSRKDLAMVNTPLMIMQLSYLILMKDCLMMKKVYTI